MCEYYSRHFVCHLGTYASFTLKFAWGVDNLNKVCVWDGRGLNVSQYADCVGWKGLERQSVC